VCHAPDLVTKGLIPVGNRRGRSIPRVAARGNSDPGFPYPWSLVEELQHRGEGRDPGRRGRLDQQLDVGDTLARVGAQGGGQFLGCSPVRRGALPKKGDFWDSPACRFLDAAGQRLKDGGALTHKEPPSIERAEGAEPGITAGRLPAARGVPRPPTTRRGRGDGSEPPSPRLRRYRAPSTASYSSRKCRSLHC
jgi:hypothetical protein